MQSNHQENIRWTDMKNCFDRRRRRRCVSNHCKLSTFPFLQFGKAIQYKMDQTKRVATNIIKRLISPSFHQWPQPITAMNKLIHFFFGQFTSFDECDLIAHFNLCPIEWFVMAKLWRHRQMSIVKKKKWKTIVEQVRQMFAHHGCPVILVVKNKSSYRHSQIQNSISFTSDKKIDYVINTIVSNCMGVIESITFDCHINAQICHIIIIEMIEL